MLMGYVNNQLFLISLISIVFRVCLMNHGRIIFGFHYCYCNGNYYCLKVDYSYYCDGYDDDNDGHSCNDNVNYCFYILNLDLRLLSMVSIYSQIILFLS